MLFFAGSSFETKFSSDSSFLKLCFRISTMSDSFLKILILKFRVLFLKLYFLVACRSVQTCWCRAYSLESLVLLFMVECKQPISVKSAVAKINNVQKRVSLQLNNIWNTTRILVLETPAPTLTADRVWLCLLILLERTPLPRANKNRYLVQYNTGAL